MRYPFLYYYCCRGFPNSFSCLMFRLLTVLIDRNVERVSRRMVGCTCTVWLVLEVLLVDGNEFEMFSAVQPGIYYHDLSCKSAGSFTFTVFQNLKFYWHIISSTLHLSWALYNNQILMLFVFQQDLTLPFIYLLFYVYFRC